MVNFKCRKLFMRGKDFCCLVKGEVITDCDKDCKDIVLTQAWKNIMGNINYVEDKNIKKGKK